MFTGFSDATVDFLWGIRFNNEKPWFEEHKDDKLNFIAKEAIKLEVKRANTVGDLLRGHAAAGALIHHLSVAAVGGAGGVQLAAAAKAGIDEIHSLQLFKGGKVDIAALALVIGAVGAALAAALVPVQAQPRQILLQRIGIHPGTALGVQILDAQHDAPAGAFGRQPRQQTARQIAQMHPPAGGRCKTTDNFHTKTSTSFYSGYPVFS